MNMGRRAELWGRKVLTILGSRLHRTPPSRALADVGSTDRFVPLLESTLGVIEADPGVESSGLEEVTLASLCVCFLPYTPALRPVSYLQSYRPADSLSTILPFDSAPAMGSTSRWTPAGLASSTPGAGRSLSSLGGTKSGCECS